jgi:CIC family chloride channel protein
LIFPVVGIFITSLFVRYIVRDDISHGVTRILYALAQRISETGTIENVFTSTSFEKTFDSIAESVIKESPQWSPAIDHNRKVKCRFTQVVNFKNYKEPY